MTDHDRQKVDVAALLEELQALLRESTETLDALIRDQLPEPFGAGFVSHL